MPAKKLKLTQFGNPVLRKKAKAVPMKQITGKRIRTLISNMFETVHGIGVGLAAPQVGESLQLAVIEVAPLPHRADIKPFPKTVIINPKIIKYSRETDLGWEGCLSCSNEQGNALLWGKVPRSKQVTVQFYDAQGDLHRKTYTGFPARVFQHEVDHLNGLVFVDRMTDMKTLSTTRGMEQARKQRK